MDLTRSYPEVMAKAFELRQQGLNIVNILGKRAVHPVSLGIGRFTIPPDKEDLSRIRGIASLVMRTVREMALQLNDFSANKRSMEISHTIPFNFLTYEEDDEYEGFRVFDPNRCLTHEFSRVGFEDYVEEIHADWTFAKFPYLKPMGFPDGIVLVGPLARLNRNDNILKDPEIGSLGPALDLRASGVFKLEHTDICRLLEIYWAAKKLSACWTRSILTSIRRW